MTLEPHSPPPASPPERTPPPPSTPNPPTPPTPLPADSKIDHHLSATPTQNHPHLPRPVAEEGIAWAALLADNSALAHQPVQGAVDRTERYEGIYPPEQKARPAPIGFASTLNSARQLI